MRRGSLMYVDAIQVGNRSATVECIDACGVRRTMPINRIAKTPSDRTIRDAMLISLDLSKLAYVCASEFFECLDINTDSMQLHQHALCLDETEQRLLIHPTTLITGILEHWSLWSRVVLRPHVLDQFYWSHIDGRRVVTTEDRLIARAAENEGFQRLLQWTVCHRSARRFVSSLHWYALNHRLMADLPLGELVLLAHAAHRDSTSAITKIRLLAILTDEHPDLDIASDYAHERRDRRPIVINSRLLVRAAEDPEGLLVRRVSVSDQCRALIRDSKPDQPTNWLQRLKNQSETSIATVFESFGG